MDLQACLSNAHLMCFDKRRRHWPQVEADLAALGIHTRRFIMGDGLDAGLVYDHVDRHKMELPFRQRLNYCEAVQSLLRRELQAGASGIFISEDDNKLCPHTLERWPGVQEQLRGQEWDMLYLHSVRVHSRTTHVAPNLLLMLDGCLGFRALCMNRRAMEAVAGDITACTWKGVDGLIRDAVHPQMRVVTVWPCLLRGDGADAWSHQESYKILPEWLDMCLAEKGDCR